MYLLASTEGWVANMIDSGGFKAVGSGFVFVVLLAILLASACALNGFRRFGRNNAPWWVAIAYTALFTGFGYWMFKLPGAVPGLFCVWAFQRGRIHSARVANHFNR
jgi:hypothetical protein